jgi:hypothetical protein
VSPVLSADAREDVIAGDICGSELQPGRGILVRLRIPNERVQVLSVGGGAQGGYVSAGLVLEGRGLVPRRLGLTEATVATYLKGARAKLGVVIKAELNRRIMELGYLRAWLPPTARPN